MLVLCETCSYACGFAGEIRACVCVPLVASARLAVYHSSTSGDASGLDSPHIIVSLEVYHIIAFVSPLGLVHPMRARASLDRTTAIERDATTM